jgi:large repetitive protein
MKHAATKRTLALPLWAAALMIWTLNIAQADAATVSAPTDFVIAQGQTGAVPISVTDAGAGVVGVDVTLQYDSSVIEVFGTGSSAIQQSGFSTDGWILEQNIVTVSGATKELRISAASSGSSLPTSGTSTLFTITFQAVGATSPTSSALTLTLADLNEAAVTASSGSVKLGGVTGALTLTPDPVKPSESVLVTLTDADLNTSSSTVQTINVTIRSKTSGGSTKETQLVLLTETGVNTAVFSGGFSTTYGTTGVAGGKFEVVPTDDLEGEYTDGFDANGDAGTAVTDLIDVVAGVDGTVSTSPASVSAGNNVTITVTDADQANKTRQVSVSVRRISTSGITIIETETYTVFFNGSGVGTVIAPTSSAAGSAGNGTLNVQSGDQIIVSYDDPVGSTGAPVAGVSSITATSGAFSGVPSTIEVTDLILFSLTDSDLGDGTKVSGISHLNVTVRNTTTGEIETIDMVETSPFGTGLYTVKTPDVGDLQGISTVFSDGSSPSPSDDGVLGVKPNDIIVIEYSDPLDASGNATTITSSNITVDGGTTGTVSTTPAAVNPGDSFTITVTDPDLTVNHTYIGHIDILVKRNGVEVDNEGNTIGSTGWYVLFETSPGSGVFTRSFNTVNSGTPTPGNSAIEVQAGDQIVVQYHDPAGSGNVPTTSISVTATNGAFNSVPASIAVADVLNISLTDADIADGTRVNGAGTLTATVRNTTSGETEAVTLTENPAGSGTFTSSINTAFSGAGTSGNNNNGTLGVAVGDVVVIDYIDNLNAAGGSSTITSSNINITGGGDGTVATAPASINPGQSVSITVQDADLGNSGTVQVTLRTSRGESVALTLNATGSGNNFTGSIATTFTSGATTVGAPLDVKAGDSIVADYIDLVTSGGGAVTRTSSPATAVVGGVTGAIVASADIQSGDGLRIQVTDSDLNVSFTTAETATATVTNNTNGDVETITLTETGINTGIFRATPPATTGSGSATSGDGTV